MITKMGRSVLIATVLLFLKTVPVVYAQIDSCTGINQIPGADPNQKWSGTKSTDCSTTSPQSRIRNIWESKGYLGNEFDSISMNVDCCSMNGVDPSGDYCEMQDVAGPGLGPWRGADYTSSCIKQPGGYVAGIYLSQLDYGSNKLHGCAGGDTDGHFQAHYLQMKCCYPSNPPPETCDTGLKQVADDYHLHTTGKNGCTTPGGFIRTLKFGEYCYGTGDQEENGLWLGCCTAKPTPTPLPCDSTTTNANYPIVCKFGCTEKQIPGQPAGLTQDTVTIEPGVGSCSTKGIAYSALDGCERQDFMSCAVDNSGNNPGAIGTSTSTSTSTATSTSTSTSTGGCDPSFGGTGRQCTFGASACAACGNTCVPVGNQPLRNDNTCISGDPACVEGVHFKDSIANNFDTVMWGAGNQVPNYDISFNSVSKVCMPSTKIPSANLADPGNYQDVGITSQNAGIDYRLITWDTTGGGGYICSLQYGDKHRTKTAGGINAGCSCAAGYEPYLFTPTQYTATQVASNDHPFHTKAEELWASVLHFLIHNQETIKKADRIYSSQVPSAQAATSTTAPLYMDGTSADIGTKWTATSYATKNHGTAYGSDPYPSPSPYLPVSGAKAKASLGALVMGCVKSCPLGSAVRGKLDPTTCDCTAVGQAFDPTNWKCQTCPEGSISYDSTAPAGTQCKCATGYSVINNKCRPNAPLMPGSAAQQSEFVRSATISDGYPVCGTDANGYGRLPVKPDFTISNTATFGTPATTAAVSVSIGSAVFPYASASPNPSPVPITPWYLYADRTHCACVAHTVANTLTATPAEMSTTGGARFLGDTFDVISSLGADGKPNQSFGMVAISEREVDGRLGTEFGTGNSLCGCPNVNEIPNPKQIGPDTKSGSQCVPALAQYTKDKSLVLFTQYNPVVDDPGNIMPSVRAKEAVDSLTGKVAANILVGASAGAAGTAVNYPRMIWKCQSGYTMQSDGSCKFVDANNVCGTGSPVAKTFTIGSIVNKKLACCLNMDPAATTQRFDCVDNSVPPATPVPFDFNALWASSDANNAGGQPNAFVLADGSGNPVTGFYTLQGQRCSEFSEFADPITQAIVVPSVDNGTTITKCPSGSSGTIANGFCLKTGTGAKIKQPSGTGAASIIGKLSAKIIPTTAADMRRCPILVRAALVVACPQNPSSASLPILTSIDAAGNKRCATAASAQVQMRVEQVYEIMGQPVRAPVDTVISQQNAGTISVTNIVKSKYAP